MGFIIILILTTLSIAGSAAFFSVYGVAQIFTGSFWPIVIMMSALEAGKLVTASYLYRYWKKTPKWSRPYLLSAVIGLMVATSGGIFGFLSASYQQSVLPLEISQQKIESLLTEKIEVKNLKQERLDRRKQIDTDIASLPNNFITGRQRLMKSYGPELEQIRKDISQYTERMREITDNIQELRGTHIEQKAHVGPIIYIAKAFNVDTDQAVKWFIFLIIFAFDPLAVLLTIGANVAILDRKTPKEERVTIEHDKVLIEEEHPAPVVVNQGMSSEELEEILEKRFSEHDLSPSEQLQKTIVEEMLAKKKIKEQYRRRTS